MFLARKLDPRVEWATAAPSPAGTTRFDGHRGHRSVFDKSLQRPSRPFPSARVFINISAVRSIFPHLPPSLFLNTYIFICVFIKKVVEEISKMEPGGLFLFLIIF